MNRVVAVNKFRKIINIRNKFEERNILVDIDGKYICDVPRNFVARDWLEKNK